MSILHLSQKLENFASFSIDREKLSIAIVGNSTFRPAEIGEIDKFDMVVKINLGFYFHSPYRGTRADVIMSATKEFLPAMRKCAQTIWVSRAYRQLLKRRYGRDVAIITDELRDKIEKMARHSRPSSGLSSILLTKVLFPNAEIHVFGFDGYLDNSTVSGLSDESFSPPHDFGLEQAKIREMHLKGDIRFHKPLTIVDQTEVYPLRLRYYDFKAKILRLPIISYLLEKYHPRDFS